MALIVDIVSEETIRPSSPAPPNSRIHKLSCMDQLSPPRYMPVLYSYAPEQPASSQNDVVDKLKSSLSTVLTHYYPFAGRYHDSGVSIDCNGEGVPFIVSHVAADMLPSLEAPDETRLVQLLPCRPQHENRDPADGKLLFLAVRVNFFKCGGIAIGICAWHRISDASTLACLAQCWAAICRGDPAVYKVLPGAVVDYTSFFPPQDLRYLTAGPTSSDETTIHHVDAESTVVVKRFVFPAEKIALLREKIGRNDNETFRRQPTRVEAISSLVWAATIRLAQEKRKEKGIIINQGFHSAVMVVNLRTRTSPPLPAVCMGNIIQMTETIKWPIETEVTEENMGDLAGKLGGAVRTINHEYLDRLHKDNKAEGYLNLVKSFEEEYRKDDFIMISSSCRYPIYGVDFGWGKPTSVHGFSGSNKMVVLLDARDGEGVEAWVTLDKDDMSRFEKDPFLLCYAC